VLEHIRVLKDLLREGGTTIKAWGRKDAGGDEDYS